MNRPRPRYNLPKANERFENFQKMSPKKVMKKWLIRHLAAAELFTYYNYWIVSSNIGVLSRLRFFTFLYQLSFNSTFKETWSDKAIKLKFGLSWNYHKILLRINMILDRQKLKCISAFIGNRFKFMVHGHFHLSVEMSPLQQHLRAWHFGLETSRFWNGRYRKKWV